MSVRLERIAIVNLRLQLTLLFLVLGGVAAAVAQDWPCWRGTGHDGKIGGFIAPAEWPPVLKRQWRTSVGLGDATPALVGDRLYAFGRLDETEVVFCLDVGDGRERWRHAYQAVSVTGPAERYAGPRSSPAVAGGKVVALGVGGVLTGLDADTGELAWRHEALAAALPMFFTSMSPLVTQGLCVVHLGGKDEGLLVALELHSGKVKWQWAGEGPAYASPVPLTINGAMQVVVQTEQSLAGHAWADGRRLWQVPTSPKPGYWNSVTPVVAEATVIYSGQGTGTRAVRIESQGTGFTAREVWHQAELGTVYNTPVLKDGLLFALSDRGRYFCLDQVTGATQWISTNRVSNFGSLVDAGPVLVTSPEKSGLVMLEPSREGYRELARYPVSDTPIYAHPVVAGRRVFVRDADSVTLWMLGD
ncbi:MAG: PQQ-binding-like beta-propeller repeat protein [Verrucomicrobia bacterium]|nr:PQQ-binding-like beta-propeller repeat protein [Verrucomicrobiota bacterium]